MSSVLSSTTLVPLLDASTKKTSKKHMGKRNAQAQLTQFWNRYHSKAPARITSIFPKKLYEGLVPIADTPGLQVRNAARSYEDARSRCRALVRRAVAECERMNCRFSDAEFDIESDLSSYTFNCLYGLGHDAMSYMSDSDDDGDDEPKKKVSTWQMQSALRNLAKSEVLTDNTASFKLDKLNKYVGFDFSDFRCDHFTAPPQSVHRLDWIFENPQFTVDGYSSSDIKQGKCGDCWWLAGLASFAHRKDIMDKICVARDEECGVYGFVFWKDGEWISTVIDDNLYLTEQDYGKTKETYDATGKKARLHRKEKQTGSKALYFSHCENENETWLPLLEKAYAKVHGDYEAIDGGWSGIAVEDLTGGVTTVLAGNAVLRKDRLWHELVKSGEVDGEFVFALSARSCGWTSAHNGIALSHAYSVLKAIEVQDEEGNRHRLVRVRNPWGEKSSRGMGEWFGPWSDGSKEWTSYMVQKMNHKPADDGNFWISFTDLLDNFKWIHRTRLFNERWTIGQQWTSSKVSWVTGYINKKFIIEVNGQGLVVIVLSQLDDRYFQGLQGQYEFSLEFLLRKAGEPTPLCQVRSVHKYDKRSANCELELESGTYEVLPRITAERNSKAKTIGQMVSKCADKNPEKLRQIGMQYDAAHAKAGVIDEDEEVEKAREQRRSKKQKRKEKRRLEEKKMKKMQKAFLEKKVAADGEEEEMEDDDDDSEVEKTVKKWFGKKLKSKGGKSSTGRNDKGITQSRKSGDGASPKSRTLEIKDADSDDDGSSSSVAGSNTPSSTVKGEDDKEKKKKKAAAEEEANSDSDSDDLSESSSDSEEEPDFDKKQPWDPVCVIGLRVYAQDAVATVRLGGKKPGEDMAAKEEGTNVVKS
ncbi:hypothetical protein NLU13_6206 [Sarocladium strictum]|uniref:Calpain catalytic domain-containing protein n=1 Tax=Sarocladium strictum TaxID=5046 RepID=A0AA39GG66_SARSR|nr:hypothetical protein NLU13_6206 [Sarocladium strictum]